MSSLSYLLAFLLHGAFIMYFKADVLLCETFKLILYQATYPITRNSLLMNDFLSFLMNLSHVFWGFTRHFSILNSLCNLRCCFTGSVNYSMVISHRAHVIRGNNRWQSNTEHASDYSIIVPLCTSGVVIGC